MKHAIILLPALSLFFAILLFLGLSFAKLKNYFYPTCRFCGKRLNKKSSFSTCDCRINYLFKR